MATENISQIDKLLKDCSDKLSKITGRKQKDVEEEILRLRKLFESEEKSMLHNVTVRKSEKKKLEEFWIMRAVHEIRTCDSETKREKINFHVIEDVESDHEPTPQEIAQFLSDSKADFVSLVQNYRFENELPFC